VGKNALRVMAPQAERSSGVPRSAQAHRQGWRLRRAEDGSVVWMVSFVHLFCGQGKKRYLCCHSGNKMEIKFEKIYLEELFYIGKTTDKKHRYQPQVAAKYRKTIDLLESVEAEEELFRYNGLRYEALHGDKEGLKSVRVNDQYRIEFKTDKVASEIVVTVCSIVELSNHYK
jgi:proteic killer suppression protein